MTKRLVVCYDIGAGCYRCYFSVLEPDVLKNVNIVLGRQDVTDDFKEWCCNMNIDMENLTEYDKAVINIAFGDVRYHF